MGLPILLQSHLPWMASSPAGWGFRAWRAFMRYWSCSGSYCLFIYFVLFWSSSYFLELKFSAGLRLTLSFAYGLAVLCNKVASQISYQRHREVQVLEWIFFLAGHALLTGPGCTCRQWGAKWGKVLLPPPAMGEWSWEWAAVLLKTILNISSCLFKIVGFTLLIIALEISIWIPSEPWCEQRHYNEIKLDERLV